LYLLWVCWKITILKMLGRIHVDICTTGTGEKYRICRKYVTDRILISFSKVPAKFHGAYLTRRRSDVRVRSKVVTPVECSRFLCGSQIVVRSTIAVRWLKLWQS
jgi:hypothetical protein